MGWLESPGQALAYRSRPAWQWSQGLRASCRPAVHIRKGLIQELLYARVDTVGLSRQQTLTAALLRKTRAAGGVHDPGTLLKNSGVTYIQPLKEYPDAGDGDNIDKYDEEMNKYIAQEVVNQVKNYNYESKILSDSLIVYHHIEPSIMASASKELVKSNDTEMNGTYGGYSAPQLLYQTSSYLNGNGLDNPKNFTAPESPMKFSLLTKGSYTINDYIKMGGIVKTYMDENGQAPDYINYEGAYISYYDLVYNFAKITQNHTNTQHMGFDSEYEFEKTNDSILLHVFPIILVIIVLYIAYSIWKRLRRH